MEQNISTQVWIIATLFGGVGAALVQLIFEFIKAKLKYARVKKHLRREIRFNIKQAEQIIEELTKLKEDHIKLDRQKNYWHYYNLKSSAVIFRALINAGLIYEYLDDDQMIKIDNFISENVSFLNEEVKKIREGQYSKNDAADKVDFFIGRYKNFQNDLSLILKKV